MTVTSLPKYRAQPAQTPATTRPSRCRAQTRGARAAVAFLVAHPHLEQNTSSSSSSPPQPHRT